MWWWRHISKSTSKRRKLKGTRIPGFDLRLCVCVCVCVCMRVCACRSVWLFATPWTVARQAPLAMEFPRQEYWSGLPFPSPGIFPTQGSNAYLLCHLYRHACSLPAEPSGETILLITLFISSSTSKKAIPAVASAPWHPVLDWVFPTLPPTM